MKFIIRDFDSTFYDTYLGMIKAFENALEDSGEKEDMENILRGMKATVRMQ